MKLKYLLWATLPIVLIVLVGLLERFFEHKSSETVLTGAKESAKNTGTKRKKLIISGEFWAPFEYRDGDELRGIDVDVFKKIFPKLGIDYEVRFYPWSRVIMMAKEGTVDFVVSVSYKKSRESFLLYTEDEKAFASTGKWPENYLWRSTYVFFCKKIYADKIRFESYAQIKKDGYKVGTVRDYSYNPEFLKAKMSTFVAPDIKTGFKMLDDGKYDLFPADKTVGLATIKQLNLSDSITYIDKPLFSKPYLLPACKASKWPGKMALMKKFFRELEILRQTGEYEKIRNKYIKKTESVRK